MQQISRLTLAAVLFFLLAGCGGPNILAPEDKRARTFLDKVQDTCGRYRISGTPVATMMNMNSDPYFLDMTSKLARGVITRQQYAVAINSFSTTKDNRQALECIFSLMDQDTHGHGPRPLN
jgi:predicted small lipoprotein YifL